MASQGLSLPSVCTFSCSACSASRRARQVGVARPSSLTASCSARRSLVERRHALLPARAGARRRRRCFASAAAARCCAARARRARSARKPFSFARPGARAARLGWRACSSTLRASAASTWICCCTWRRRRAARCCAPAPRAARPRARAARDACSSSCAGERFGRLARPRRSAPPRRVVLGAGIALRAIATAALCASSSARWRDEPLRGPRRRSGSAPRAGSTSSAASPSAPCAGVQLVAGCVVRLADRLELGLGAAQVGAPRLERGDRGDDRLALTRSSSRAASRWLAGTRAGAA